MWYICSPLNRYRLKARYVAATSIAGKDATSLTRLCQCAVDEDKKVPIGFNLSNPSTDIFTLNKGDHAGEQRVSLKARLINVDWIKIG